MKQRTTESQQQVHFEYEDSVELVKIYKRQNNSGKKVKSISEFNMDTKLYSWCVLSENNQYKASTSIMEINGTALVILISFPTIS